MSDQALCPTKHCTICRPSFGTDSDEPIYVPLVKRGLVWCCRDCGASYGENPHPSLSSAGSEDAPELEIQPRGGMTFDWQEQSLIYQRRLRALMKLVAKEGYAVSSDGRTGTPYALSRFRDAAQAAQDWKAEALRRFGPIPEGAGENSRLMAAYHYAFVEGAKAALALPSTDREPPDCGYCLCGRHRDDQCDYCVSLSSPDRGGK